MIELKSGVAWLSQAAHCCTPLRHAYSGPLMHLSSGVDIPGSKGIPRQFPVVKSFETHLE
jgi:hypothetical protein